MSNPQTTNIIEKLNWKPIESAPHDKNIIGKFWHGSYQFIVEAAPRGDGGWQDIGEDSCVGWVPGQKKPAYWLCEAPHD